MQSRDPQFEYNFQLHLLTRLGNQHFRSAYGYTIVLIVLIMFLFKTFIKLIYEVRILVRPWPDSPGWFELVSPAMINTI